MPCPVSANVRVPTVSTPLNVPTDDALKVTVNVTLAPGATSNGTEGARVMLKPVPDTDKVGTVTAEMVVCGLLTLNVNELLPLPPTMDCPKLIGVAAWAVNRTPVEST